MYARNAHVTTTRAASLALLALLALSCVGCSGCQIWNTTRSDPTTLGTRLDFGKTIVFYTSGVEESVAKKVGELLAKSFESSDEGAVVQLRYQNRRYEVRFKVRPGVEHTRTTRELRAMGEAFSKACFQLAPVDIHLCDERLATLRTVPYEPIKPNLPIEVSFRSSIGGGSLVAQYKNTSSSHLTVLVALRNPTVGHEMTVTLSLGPNRVAEHGWVQGWSYMSGETISVTHADYEAMEVRVP
jgi:hypothetical protein